MSDALLRALKRQTQVDPANGEVKDRYIAALERISGLEVADEREDEKALIESQAQECLRKVLHLDAEFRKQNPGRPHPETDLMYSFGSWMLDSIAENAVKVAIATIKAVAKQRGFDLNAVEALDAPFVLSPVETDKIFEWLETQIKWNLTEFNDPTYGTISGQITHILEVFCWDCGNHTGYQYECAVCYPKLVKEHPEWFINQNSQNVER